MTAVNPPVNGVAFIVYIALQDMANPGSYKASPTIAAGDFQISIDGGAFGNLATLPTVTPAAGRAVKISLSAAEMTGDNIFIQCVDQTTPKEWADYSFDIQTQAAATYATATALATAQADLDDIQTRLPAALVGGRIDSSVGAMAANVLTAAAIATDAIDADSLKADAVTEIQAGLATIANQTIINNNVLSVGTAVAAVPTDAENADKLLGRNLAGGSDGGRTVQDALRILRNKRSIAAGTLTVTLEDDTTPAWTAAVTTAASNPVNSIDP